MNVQTLTSEQRTLRSNIRGFLLLASPAELERELEISIERGDTFRADVIRELISEA